MMLPKQSTRYGLGAFSFWLSRCYFKIDYFSILEVYILISSFIAGDKLALPFGDLSSGLVLLSTSMPYLEYVDYSVSF